MSQTPHQPLLDWIDLLTLSFGFGLYLTLLFMSADVLGVDITSFEIVGELLLIPFCGAALYIRRLLIGKPKPRYVRPGCLASVISMFGIVAVLGGGLMVMSSSTGFIQTLVGTPVMDIDRAEIRQEIIAFQEDNGLTSVDAFIAQRRPNETEEQWQQRLVEEAAESKATLEKQIDKRVELEQQSANEDWARTRTQSRSGLRTGIILTFIGVLLLEFRSMRREEEPTNQQE